MTANEVKKIQASETVLLSAVLSFSGGFQDAYTYNLRDKVFANAQTGNIVLMSQHLMMGENFKAIHYLIPILSFAVGVFIAEQIGHKYKHCQKVHWRQMILLIEILVLGIVGFLPESCNTLANMLVSLSCAMQVQTFRKINGFAYASTMCIGNLRSGTESFSVFIRDKNVKALYKAFHYYGIIFIFAIGAGLGAILSINLGFRAIWGCLIFLIFGIFLMRK
ncbi:YoaK family protein [Butyrivibrio sp. NC3005]|uniref:YoaK family protein n=1 Tax=Butyrivibrio sp. NC3005 TaxID=1280685 RepID=UPI00040D4D66|nr:YoaK family protein [Butyrivibrio sp. NC3005]